MARRCVYCEHIESNDDGDVLYCPKKLDFVDDYKDDSEAKECNDYEPACEEGEDE